MSEEGRDKVDGGKKRRRAAANMARLLFQSTFTPSLAKPSASLLGISSLFIRI